MAAKTETPRTRAAAYDEDLTHMKPAEEVPPAAYYEDLTALGQVHGQWAKSKLRPQRTSTVGRKKIAPTTDRKNEVSKPPAITKVKSASITKTKPVATARRQLANAVAKHTPTKKAVPVADSDYDLSYGDDDDQYLGHDFDADTHTAKEEDDVAVATEASHTFVPSKNLDTTAGILDITQPAITSFPNAAGLKHPSLAMLDYQTSQLCHADSECMRTKHKYEEILKRAPNHEREINSLLRSARKFGHVDMVSTLEMKLIDAQKLRARAEYVLEGLKTVQQDLDTIGEKIMGLDGDVVSVVKRLMELCDTGV